jgi:hypothetical protein
MEERVGERRFLIFKPLSSILSPLVPREERKKSRSRILMCLP